MLPTGDVSALADDVARTSRDTSRTLWAISLVCMLGSIVSSWFLFDALGEPPAVGSGIALAVDFGLCMWMRIAQRLRNLGVNSRIGKIMELVCGAMTLFLNVAGAFSSFMPPHSQLAATILAIAHGFVPTVMILVGLAAPHALQQLQRLWRQENAKQEAQQRAAHERAVAEQRAERDKDRAVETAKQNRLTAEAADRTRTAELVNEQHQRDMANCAAERDLRQRELAASLAAALQVATTFRALVMTNLGARRQPGASRPRQGRSPASPALVASGSPAGIARCSPGVRQPSSPAPRLVKPQDKPDVARLAELAKHLLAEDPGMGRAQLAKELGVTPHYARQALAHITAERDAAKEQELLAMLDGQPLSADQEASE